MILVDTSIWIDHLRQGDAMLTDLLQSGQVLAHDFVIGELALGNLQQRRDILSALKGLPQAVKAQDDEVLHFIEQQNLNGLGIGYVDAHLLAATRLMPGTRLWTRDKRLQGAAKRLGVVATWS